MSTNSTEQNGLQISDGYLYIEGVKLCRVDLERQTLYFLDKDRRRASARGSDQVGVPIAALVSLGQNKPTTGE